MADRTPIQVARESTLPEFLTKIVRLGFELETQAIAGLDYSGLHSQEIECEREETVLAESVSEFSETVSNTYAKAEKLARILLLRKLWRIEEIQGLCVDGWNTLNDQRRSRLKRSRHFSGYLNGVEGIPPTQLVGMLLGQIADVEIRRKLNRAMSAYYRSIMAAQNLVARKTETTTKKIKYKEAVTLPDFLISKGVKSEVFSKFDWKSDGSVQGPEITTIGAKTFSEVLDDVDLLFPTLRGVGVAVDHGCSFHIHVSADGVRPVHSAAFQAAMIAFVLNSDSVPTRVRDRWSSDSLRRYYNFGLDGDKYRFVAYRGNTWEFRCFGNISDTTDAKVCLQLAATAYWLALTDRLPAINLPIGMSFVEIAQLAVRNGITFDAAFSEIAARNQDRAA